MRFARLLSIAGIVLPEIAHAQLNPCPLQGIIPCATGGVSGVNAFINFEIIPAMKIAFAGLMLIFFVYYAIRLILESGEESTVSEIKSAYGQAMAGAVFVSVAGLFVAGVGNSASTTLINSQQGGPIWEIFSLLVNYGKWLMGTLVLIFIAFQGARLVIFSSDESELEKQKTRFFHGLIGVAVTLLASAIVNTVTNSDAGILGAEMKGIANFMLEIFGILVVLSFIMSGLFMVLSVDEGLKDRAKKAVFGSVIGMIVVFAAYLIVTYVLTV